MGAGYEIADSPRSLRTRREHVATVEHGEAVGHVGEDSRRLRGIEGRGEVADHDRLEAGPEERLHAERPIQHARIEVDTAHGDVRDVVAVKDAEHGLLVVADEVVGRLDGDRAVLAAPRPRPGR
jgi:hypothetical protein